MNFNSNCKNNFETLIDFKERKTFNNYTKIQTLKMSEFG